MLTAFGCSGTVRSYPADEQLACIEDLIEVYVQRAEQGGVKGAGAPRAAPGVSRRELATFFTVHADIARDFPRDEGRVGVFLADTLLPSLLRSIDATSKANLPDGARSLEVIVGVILINDYVLRTRSAELEQRLIDGAAGLGSLYWARDLEAGLSDAVCLASIARYQSILDRCDAREGGCSEQVRAAVQASMDELQGFIDGTRERPTMYR